MIKITETVAQPGTGSVAILNIREHLGDGNVKPEKLLDIAIKLDPTISREKSRFNKGTVFSLVLIAHSGATLGIIKGEFLESGT